MNGWIALGLSVALLGAGAYGEKVYRDGIDAAQALDESEARREQERTAARDRAAKLDQFARAREADRAAALDAQRSADSVRREADRLASRSRAAGAGADAATIAGLAELLAEGADLAREGRADLELCWETRDALTPPGGRP